MPITTNVKISFIAYGEVLSIQTYVIQCVSGFLLAVYYPPLTARYIRNIVENGIKHS